MTVGIGVVTYNRPDFAEVCIKSIQNYCIGYYDHLIVYDDGSDEQYREQYERLFGYVRAWGLWANAGAQNRGVGYAKNQVLEFLLPHCDWVFLVEDDVEVVNRQAVTGYLSAAQRHGVHHLSFAHHGPGNAGGPREVEGELAFYPNSIGAWGLYSREVIQAVGMFDEQMVNAFEHVEHDLRIVSAGYTPGGHGRYVDAKGSSLWLREQPDAIERSSIRPRPDWQANIQNSRERWMRTRPDTYRMVFG